MNVSATVNVLRLLVNPALCLPHHTVPTFDQLPVPLSSAFTGGSVHAPKPDIRAVVLDKDNCFAIPQTNEVHPAYAARFAALKAEFPGARLLIVSNSAGTRSDRDHGEAALLERNTGVAVLRHATPKPGCGAEIMAFFRRAPGTGVTHAGQVAIVGDRLFTDVLMANMMGSHAVWVREGPVPDSGILSRMEKGLAGFLLRRGYTAPAPRSDFE